MSDADLKLIIIRVLQNGLLVIKNQSLTPIELKKFTKKLGSIVQLSEQQSAGEYADDTEQVVRISNIFKNGGLIPNRYAVTDWHTDGDFWPGPDNHVWSILYGETIPRSGGDKAFADCHEACLALSNGKKKFLQDKKIVVDFSRIEHIHSPAGCDNSAAKNIRFSVTRHNIIGTHPVTGRKYLYVSGPVNIIQVEDYNPEDSKKMMCDLHQHIFKSTECYVHKWQKGDLVIWDNLVLIHRAYGDYKNQPILLYRTQFRPYV